MLTSILELKHFEKQFCFYCLCVSVSKNISFFWFGVSENRLLNCLKANLIARISNKIKIYFILAIICSKYACDCAIQKIYIADNAPQIKCIFGISHKILRMEIFAHLYALQKKTSMCVRDKDSDTNTEKSANKKIIIFLYLHRKYIINTVLLYTLSIYTNENLCNSARVGASNLIALTILQTY